MMGFQAFIHGPSLNFFSASVRVDGVFRCPLTFLITVDVVSYYLHG